MNDNPLGNDATKLYIDYESYTTVTNRADPDDEWGADDTSTDHYVNGLSLTRKNSHEYCYYPGEVNKGDTLYLIYAIWSTGDSFHHDTRGCIDFVAVYKDKATANLVAHVLENHKHEDDRHGKYNWTANIMLDNGEEFKYHVGWLGYFENLDEIYVEEYTVR